MTLTDNTGDLSSHLPEIAEKNALKSRAFRHSSTVSHPQYSADLVQEANLAPPAIRVDNSGDIDLQLQGSEIDLDESGKLAFQKKAYNDYVQKLRSITEHPRFLRRQLSKEEEYIKEQTHQSKALLE